jgi:hypothetical protein
MRRDNMPKNLKAIERSNLECALIIVADADRYGGEDALAVKWARTVLSRQPAEQERAA